jgi:hypothetical protein
MKSRFFAICLTVLAVLAAIRLMNRNAPQFQFGTLHAHTKPAIGQPSAIVRALRPNFPYSVIAGGAYSPGELRFADSKDAIIRAHYADFDISRAKMMTLTDDRFEYVSYRVKNQIFWTKKKLRIPKGELLVSDGHNFARARCGNRLSDQPHETAASAHEPDSALLSLPPVSLETLPNLAFAEPPALNEIPPAVIPAESRSGAAAPLPEYSRPLVPLGSIWVGRPVVGGGLVPISPALAPIVSTGGTPAPPTPPGITPLPPPVMPPSPPPVTPIPEPGTIYLFLISLVVSVWMLLRISPKDKSQR